MAKNEVKVTMRRQLVVDSYAAGDTCRETVNKVLADPRFVGTKPAVIRQDRKWAHEVFVELMDKDSVLDDAKDVYLRRNRALREIAITEHQVGKKCEACGNVVRFVDPRALKIAVDLDKDEAKVAGVYTESVTIRTEDAKGFVASVLDMIDKLSPDPGTRVGMLSALQEIAAANNIGG